MRPLIPRAALLASTLLAAQAAAQASCPTVMDPPQRPVQGTTLTMAPATYRIGTTQYTANVYNGQFVAPTLTMRPGERFVLSVVNNMRGTNVQPDSMIYRTNFHTHGLVVTPSPDSGDNVTHVSIRNGGGRHSYHFPVPAYHTTGMFWYHPHPHELTSSQVAGGLSGALMVGSILKYFPQYAGVRERTLLIRDMSFSFSSPTLLNINGSPCATFPIAAGQQQLWHIGNFGSNHFVNLKLAGGAQWTLLALDGNPLAAPEQVDSLFIAPGSRAEVIVTGPAAGQRVQLISAPFLTGPSQPTTLGYLVGTSGGLRAAVRPALPGLLKEVRDTVTRLASATDVQRYTFRYSFPQSGGAAVNDTLYAPNHPPVSIPWGRVQEWTIVNETAFPHTFHIHQTDFLVTTVNGKPANEGRLRDNVTIGVHQVNGQTVGDTVVLRFIFEPIAAGPFVFHCHVLQHEDEGMMHNVCVYDPRDPDGPRKCNAMFADAAPAHGH